MKLTRQDKVFVALGLLSLLPILFIVIPSIVRTQNALTQADNTLREVEDTSKKVSISSPKPVEETSQSYQPRDTVRYTSTPKPTDLDRATATAQDCFAENSGRDQRVCIPYLVDMEEAAKRDAIRR